MGHVSVCLSCLTLITQVLACLQLNYAELSRTSMDRQSLVVQEKLACLPVREPALDERSKFIYCLPCFPHHAAQGSPKAHLPRFLGWWVVIYPHQHCQQLNGLARRQCTVLSHGVPPGVMARWS